MLVSSSPSPALPSADDLLPTSRSSTSMSYTSGVRHYSGGHETILALDCVLWRRVKPVAILLACISLVWLLSYWISCRVSYEVSLLVIVLGLCYRGKYNRDLVIDGLYESCPQAEQDGRRVRKGEDAKMRREPLRFGLGTQTST